MHGIYRAIFFASLVVAVFSLGCSELIGESGLDGMRVGVVSSELVVAEAASFDGARTAEFEVVPDSGFPATDADGTTFFIDTALAYVRDIELDLPAELSCTDFDVEAFVAPVSCINGENVLAVDGPFVIDLIEASSTPPLVDIGLPAGVYERIDIRFDDAEVSEGLITAESPLNENTMYIAGTFVFDLEDVNEVEKTFELALKFNEDVRFEEETGGIELDEGATENLVLMLDVSQWFAALPITTCIDDGDLIVDGNSHLLITDSGNCSTIENDLKEAMKTSGQLDKE
jgi:hypothetical protein